MKKVISIALALLMVAVMLPVMAMAEGANVAKIGNTEYATLKEAFDAVPNGETIVVMKNCSGNGIVVNSGRNFTVDFNNCTYDIDGTTVGSTGTETNGFQLLKDSTITFKNGKLTSTKAKILIQNYCNLTLENMELDGRNLNSSNPNYTLSNNNGDVVIKDTTIFAAAGMVAFDVCRFAAYTGPSVTVQGNSVINGKVEISSDGPKDGARHELVIENGTFNGAIESVGASPNFTGHVYGGTFNTDVTPYVGQDTLAVTDGSNYYVGNTAKSTIENATSGTFEIVGGADVNLTVKGGVTIKVTGAGSAVINGKIITNDDGPYTVPGTITIIVPSEGGSTTTTPSTDSTKNPSTGANDFVGVAAAMAVVSLLGAAAVIRKK